MTIVRQRLSDVYSTPYYHVTARSVRRAFLCGIDRYSGVNYSHRRAWIENKLFKLESIFAINIAAYAIMRNHFHLILKIGKEN